MSDIGGRLHIIRNHLRSGALGQREAWEEWLNEAVDEIARLTAAVQQHEIWQASLVQQLVDKDADNERLRAALKGMLMEWDKLSKYGSPIAKAANERVNAARAALEPKP